MHAKWICGLALVAMLGFPSISEAHGRRCRRGCQPECHVGASPCGSAPCATTHSGVECEPVTQTVMAPIWVTETRVVPVRTYVNEERSRQVSTMKMVPETTTVMRPHTVMIPVEKSKTITQMVSRRVVTPVTQTYTIMQPEWREKEVSYNICRPVTREVSREVTSMVPELESRTANRTTCRMVAVQKTRERVVNCGYWETQTVEQAPQVARASGCGDCRPQATTCHRVWVPKVERRTETYTSYEPQRETTPYTYQVTVLKPVTKTVTSNVTEMVQEPATKMVKYMVKVPVQKTRKINNVEVVSEPIDKTVRFTVYEAKTDMKPHQVTTSKYVQQFHNETYTVRVPQESTKEVQVRVCKMVEKTIAVRPAANCQSNCRACR